MTITKNTSGKFTIECDQGEMNLISMSFAANTMKMIEIGVDINKGTGKKVIELQKIFKSHSSIKKTDNDARN